MTVLTETDMNRTTMTVKEVLSEVSKRKPISEKSLYRYFKACNIKPVGAVRQRPQQYPADTVQRIEELLGLRIVSMETLRDVRRRAKAPRAARVNGRRNGR